MSMLTEQDFYWVDIFRDIREETDKSLSKYSLIDFDCVSDHQYGRSVKPDDADDHIPNSLPDGIGRALYAPDMVETQRAFNDLRSRMTYSKSSTVNSVRNLPFIHKCEHLLSENEKGNKKITAAVMLSLEALSLEYSFSCNSDEHKNEIDKKMKKGEDMMERVLENLNVENPEEEKSIDPKSNALRNIADAPSTLALPFDTDAMRRRYIPTAPPHFELSDVPSVELQERLRKGEIAPREEFIPGKTEYRKEMNPQEQFIRMDFGERLRKEGKMAMEKKDYEKALTLYTQGVHLLEHYTGETSERKFEVSELFSTFLRNSALAALKLNRWFEAKDSCTKALQEDEYDAKAKFIRGRAFFFIGDYESAESDWHGVSTGPHSTDEQRLAARGCLQELQNAKNKNKYQVKKTIEKAAEDNVFGDNRPPPSSYASISNSDHKSSREIKSSRPDFDRSKLLIENPILNSEQFESLLLRMIDIYTSPTVADEIQSIHLSSDFGEKNIILKLRKLIPTILDPLFSEFGIETSSGYNSKKKLFDRLALHYRTFDSNKFRPLLRRCNHLLFGELIDEFEDVDL